MTESEQFIALAEWEGWKWISLDNGYDWGIYSPDGKIRRRYDGAKYEHIDELPRYHSLDEIARLEQKVLLTHSYDYNFYLGETPVTNGGLYNGFSARFATAGQRREALLRTLKLWRD